MDGLSAAKWETIVVGAGAAGLIAAERSGACGRKTLLIEKSKKPGVKILMSGGTRCNLTHHTDCSGIVRAFGKQGSFLHAPLSHLSPQDVVDLFEKEGVKTKVESTGKVFPRSNRALDVRDALVRRLNASEVTLKTGEAVTDLSRDQHGEFRVQTANTIYRCGKLIITVGGQSYPGCGTTGDGYAWLRDWGHTIVPPIPALAPLTTSDQWLHQLKGISFQNVELWADSDVETETQKAKQERLIRCRGDMLLTHFGLSGPAPMNISRVLGISGGHPPIIYCDFFPEHRQAELEQLVRHLAQQSGKRSWLTGLSTHMPQRFAESLLKVLGLDGQRRGSEVPNPWVVRVAESLKRLRMKVTGTRGFAKAEVTAGGVALGEVRSKTMESKIVPKLFLAGEILDLDGPIGGFNFQAAFSTGWLAGYQGQNPRS